MTQGKALAGYAGAGVASSVIVYLAARTAGSGALVSSVFLFVLFPIVYAMAIYYSMRARLWCDDCGHCWRP